MIAERNEPFELVKVGGVEGIRCNHCGRVSLHPQDVQERRCRFCKREKGGGSK